MVHNGEIEGLDPPTKQFLQFIMQCKQLEKSTEVADVVEENGMMLSSLLWTCLIPSMICIILLTPITASNSDYDKRVALEFFTANINKSCKTYKKWALKLIAWLTSDEQGSRVLQELKNIKLST